MSAKEEKEKSKATIILALSSAGGRLRWSDLLEKTGLSKRTLSLRLKDLEEKEGLIRRVVDTETKKYPPPVYYELTKQLNIIDLFFADLRRLVNLTEEEVAEGKRKVGKILEKWAEFISSNLIRAETEIFKDPSLNKDEKEGITRYIATQFYNPYAFSILMINFSPPTVDGFVIDSDAYYGMILNSAIDVFSVTPELFGHDVGFSDLKEAHEWWSNIAWKLPGFLSLARFVLLSHGFFKLLTKEENEDVYRRFMKKYYRAFLKEMSTEELREHASGKKFFTKFLKTKAEVLEEELKTVEKELKDIEKSKKSAP